MKLRPYPKYKDSGVEWLGEIPEGWEIIRIKKLAKHGCKTFVDGDWIEFPFIKDNGIRLIQTGNIGIGIYKEQGFKYIDEKTFAVFRCTEVLPNNVLICRLADPVGRACLAPNLGIKMITSVDVCILKPSDKFDSRYIVYFLSSNNYLDYLGSLSRGSTRGRISRSMLGNIEFVAPSLEEQTKIAKYLEQKTFKIDELIKKNERLVELLKEKRQAIISQAVTKGLDPNVKMKDSGVEWLGKIPEKWRVIRLKYLINSIKIGPFGSQLKLDEMVKEGYKVYGQENIINKDFSLGQRYITEKKYKSLRACELSPGDIVITMMGTIGKCDIFPEDAKRGIMDSHLLKITSNKFTIPEFLALILENAYYVQEGVYIASKGSIMSGLNSQIIKSLLIVLPDIKKQREIMAYLNSVFKQYAMLTYKIESSIEKLKEYRQTLISNVVTGKVRVSQSHF